MAQRINNKYNREWKVKMSEKIKANQKISFTTKFKPVYDWLRLQLLDHHRRFAVHIMGGTFHITTETDVCPLCNEKRMN